MHRDPSDQQSLSQIAAGNDDGVTSDRTDVHPVSSLSWTRRQHTPCFCCRRLVDTNTGRFSCHHGLWHRSSSRCSCAPPLWPLWASGSHPSTVRQEYHRLPRLPFAIRGTPDCGCCYALFPNPALPPPPVLCLPAHLVRIFSLLSGLRPMHSHNGTSQAMLLVAYTMWVNGNVVGIGLGRRVN